MSNLSFEKVSKFFNIKLKLACKKLMVSTTTLKKWCRNNNITRWPHRKLKSLERTVEKVEQKIKNCTDESARNLLVLKKEGLENEVAKIFSEEYYYNKKSFQKGVTDTVSSTQSNFYGEEIPKELPNTNVIESLHEENDEKKVNLPSFGELLRMIEDERV